MRISVVCLTWEDFLASHLKGCFRHLAPVLPLWYPGQSQQNQVLAPKQQAFIKELLSSVWYSSRRKNLLIQTQYNGYSRKMKQTDLLRKLETSLSVHTKKKYFSVSEKYHEQTISLLLNQQQNKFLRANAMIVKSYVSVCISRLWAVCSNSPE